MVRAQHVCNPSGFGWRATVRWECGTAAGKCGHAGTVQACSERVWVVCCGQVGAWESAVLLSWCAVHFLSLRAGDAHQWVQVGVEQEKPEGNPCHALCRIDGRMDANLYVSI